MAPILQSSLRLILGIALFSTCLVSIKMLMRIYEVTPPLVSTTSTSSSSRIKIPQHIREQLNRQVTQTTGSDNPTIGQNTEDLDTKSVSESNPSIDDDVTMKRTGKILVDTNTDDSRLPNEWDWSKVQGWQDKNDITEILKQSLTGAPSNIGETIDEASAVTAVSSSSSSSSSSVIEQPIIEAQQDTETDTIEDIRFIQHEEEKEGNVPDTHTATEDNSQTSTSTTITEGMDPFIGSHEDLAHHQSNTACWEHFDFGMLQQWDSRNAIFCTSNEDKDKGVHNLDPSTTKSSSSWLRCRVTVDTHLPPLTAPHTMCDGANILVDIGKFAPTLCLPSRPGYKCDGPPVHWLFNQGALGGICNRLPSFVGQAFPRDHLMDMFNSFAAPVPEKDTKDFARTTGDTVLLIAREKGEHANPFHATADFLNAFFTLHTTGIVNGPVGSRTGMEKVQVLLLDEQIGPFDDTFIKRVFCPNHSILRISKLQRGDLEGIVQSSSSGGTSSVLRGGSSSSNTNGNNNNNNRDVRITLPHALFVPPGYTNMLLAHVVTEGECHAGTHLFQSFRRFVLSAYNLDQYIDWTIKDSTVPVSVTLVSRRPYTTFVEHNFIGRQIDNEDELMKGLESIPNVKVTRLDFARISVEDQMLAIATTEVLVAMHGAALTFAMFMPHHGSVVEMWPKDRDMWRCFEHISAMSGLQYARWENRNVGAFRVDSNGDYTTINLPEFLGLYRVAVDGARKRRGTIIEDRKGAELELEKGRGW